MAVRKRTTKKSSASPQQIPSWTGAAYLAAIFLSAFLLFQVQPLISKAILPWFGGAPTVWTTSMMFFQVVLLAGYAYAHYVNQRLRPGWQSLTQAIVVVVALVTLGVLPAETWKPATSTAPTWQILVLLTVHVGAPFFVLSTSAPLLQAWWNRMGGEEPYRLYALSNAGSLAALISYPFVVEPRIGIQAQAALWSGLFVLLAILLMACSAAVWRWPQATSRSANPESATSSRGDPQEGSGPPSIGLRLSWIFLTACASMLLLAVTNHVCQEVAVIPLLWVAPMALYLLSFIVCFGRTSLYRRSLFFIATMGLTYLSAALYRKLYISSFFTMLALHMSTLFVGCMVCHGELVRLKPTPRYLTSFYMHVAAGGAIGGIFVSLIAPRIFADYFEYPLALMACWCITLVTLFYDSASRMYRGKRRWSWVLVLVFFAGFVGLVSDAVVSRYTGVWYLSRDFFGTLKVRILDQGDPKTKGATSCTG